MTQLLTTEEVAERLKVDVKTVRAKSCVYFVQMETSRHVKIGTARDLEKRLLYVRCGNPEPLSILLTVPGRNLTETRFHRAFKKWRLQGEWFQWNDRLEETIKRLKEPQPLEVVLDWLATFDDEFDDLRAAINALEPLK